jgi:hypothetical protein
MIWLAALFAWLPVALDEPTLVGLWVALLGLWALHHLR